jgi:EpsI family protein
MTINRLTVLLVILIAGFCAVFFLPTSGKTEPVGIKLALPDYVGKWYGVDQPITERERQVLAGDTEFARKVYKDGLGDFVFASIVLSGHDLDNSIHRPERCLPAQGWTIADSKTLAVPLPSGGKLQVTRLHNVRQVPTRDGKTVSIYNLNYYWFVGYHHLTASHLERTFLDIQDRILKGYNQRWAYIMVASDITEGLIPYGRSESQTDAIIQEFIERLFPQINKPTDDQSVARKSETPATPASL